MRPEDTTLCETKPTGEELSRRFPRVRQLFEALLRHSKNLDEADWDMPEEDYKSMAAAIDEVFPQSPGPNRADTPCNHYPDNEADGVVFCGKCGSRR